MTREDYEGKLKKLMETGENQEEIAPVVEAILGHFDNTYNQINEFQTELEERNNRIIGLGEENQRLSSELSKVKNAYATAFGGGSTKDQNAKPDGSYIKSGREITFDDIMTID